MRSAPLDGVRALAILAVLLFHAHYGWAAGGYLGVDLFFVLSGFLITRVLLSTHRSWWGYRDFLLRRAVRLVPALAVAVAGIAGVVLLTGTAAERARVLPCGATSLGYVMNLPFAEQLECRAIWHITWSLASEQQFYLLWPLVLAGSALAARRLLAPGGRHRLLLVAGIGALNAWVLALAWQAHLLAGGAATSRIAYAPDGRSLVLLLGCALALLSAGRPLRWSAARGREADAAAGAAVVVLGLCVLHGDLGRGVPALLPMVLAGLASAVLVRAAAAPGPVTTAVLGARPVAWLGRVSYSLYLWHEVAYRLAEMLGPRGAWHVELLRFALSLAFAAASYRWVEMPAQSWWRRRVSGRAADAAATSPTSSSRSRRPQRSPHPPAAARPSTPASRR